MNEAEASKQTHTHTQTHRHTHTDTHTHTPHTHTQNTHTHTHAHNTHLTLHCCIGQTSTARLSLLPTAVVVSTETSVSTVTLDAICASHTTCTSCQDAADPYCGWCTGAGAGGACVLAGKCPDATTNWLAPGLVSNADSCPAHPVVSQFEVTAVDATSVSLSWTAAAASDDTLSSFPTTRCVRMPTRAFFCCVCFFCASCQHIS